MVDLPKKIFNNQKNDYHVPEIILGQDPGLLDSINTHYPAAWDLYKKLKKLDWDELEFKFHSCNVEFKTCDKSIYDMMVKTLAWQWEADSVASRSIVGILANVVTDSRIWTGYVRINDNENIHALTYSEIVRNSFDNPNEIVDEIMAVEEAQERMLAVARVMQAAHKASHDYANGYIQNTQELYNTIFMYFVGLYFLERVQFMASFAVTFAIGKAGYFQPISDAVKKIAQDEFEIHAQYGQEVIKALLRTSRGKQAYANCKEQIVDLLWEIIRTECNWVSYLHEDGRQLTGVTPQKLMNWTLFNANAAGTFLDVMDAVIEKYGVEFKETFGYDLEFPTKNPLPFMQQYLDIAATQASPQEQDAPDYQVNVLSRVDEQEVFDTDF